MDLWAGKSIVGLWAGKPVMGGILRDSSQSFHLKCYFPAGLWYNVRVRGLKMLIKRLRVFYP
jgi:hypothetical protein